MTQLFESLLPGEANFGLEPSWVLIYPYQSLAQQGDSLNLQVRVTNFLPQNSQAEVRLVLPEGWSATPEVGILEIAPGQRGQADYQVQIPGSYRFPYPRIAIAADVIFNGRHWGQITESTIEKIVNPALADSRR